MAVISREEVHNEQMQILHSMLADIAQDIKEKKSVVEKFIKLFETYHACTVFGNKQAAEEGTQLAEFFMELRREKHTEILTEAEKEYVGL